MACDCNNTLSKSYWLIYNGGLLGDNKYYVTEPFSGGAVVTSCNGSLGVALTTQDCVQLSFLYQGGGPNPLPLTISSNCPCEVVNPSGAPPVTYSARFKPPARGSCTYEWILQNTQPTCKIKIIVSKS